MTQHGIGPHCETCDQQLEFETCRDCHGTGTQRSVRILTRQPVEVTCQWCEGEEGFWICPNVKNHQPDQQPAIHQPT